MAWNAFLNRLRGWLDEYEVMRDEASWVVSVSGGPDSSLLLHAFHELRHRDNLNWRLHVGHMHHGYRGEDADADEAYVRELAEAHHAKVFVEHAGHADPISEEQARKERYAYLERVALTANAEIVALAHHADDDAETILHRICRGTGLRGLAGMRAMRPIQAGSRTQIIRPFLRERRDTIEKLCAERGLTPRHDKTNATTQYTRGRIRNTVLPLLREQLNPNTVEAILRLGSQARWLGTYLEDAAVRALHAMTVSESAEEIVINARALLAKQKLIQAEVVRQVVTLLSGGEQELAFSHVEGVLKLAADRASGKELHLPYHLVARKVYDRVEFARRAADEPVVEFTPTFCVCPGETQLPQLGAALQVEVVEVGDEALSDRPAENGRRTEWLDYDRVHLPLLVRGRREGDRFHPLGAPGAKSLGDFFIDEKIDPKERARIGLLCDQTGPIWVMPLRIDERVKLRDDTRRALKISLELPPPHPTH